MFHKVTVSRDLTIMLLTFEHVDNKNNPGYSKYDAWYTAQGERPRQVIHLQAINNDTNYDTFGCNKKRNILNAALLQCCHNTYDVIFK
jgi:hypothetical protein